MTLPLVQDNKYERQEKKSIIRRTAGTSWRDNSYSFLATGEELHLECICEEE